MRSGLLLPIAGLTLALLLLPSLLAVTVPGGIGSFNSAVRLASSNTVIFVYPATTTTGKPPGMFAALYTDWTAMGILIGVAQNQQYETLDTNTGTPLFIDPTTGKPGTTNMVIVTVGGVLVHSIVHWLERESASGGAISPVYYDQNATHRMFRLRTTGAVLVAQVLGAPASYDHFLIETVLDGSGNTYYVFYGFRWRGSMAASHKLLYYVQTGTLTSQTQSYEIDRWDDTNGDGIVNPSPTDTYTLVTSG